MYVILVNPDNTLYGSVKQRVMQRSKMVDTLKFICAPIYNGIDMTNASVMLEYVMPVSREYKTVLLSLSRERYKDYFLQYELPFDVDLTSQAGSLELQLTFAYVEMTPNGTGIQRVRKTSATTIDIIPITAWSDIVPDAALSSLDQRLLKLDAQMRAMNDYMDVIDSNRVDNLVYDSVEDTLQLSANGVGVGDKVSVKDILDDGIPVIDLDYGSTGSGNGSGGNSENNSGNGNNNGCNCDGCDCENNVVEFDDCKDCGNCGCEDNVVEFGYNTIVEKPNDESNVVEF